MAELVYITAIPHDPTLPRNVADADGGHPIFRTIRADYEHVRAGLAAAKPDVILMVSGDHFNQWFYDNNPTFAVGKGHTSAGPFSWEREVYGTASYQTAGDHDLGRYILEQGLKRHFDFAASDSYQIDHGFTVPLNFVRPEQDIAVVPIWTNVLMPPTPPGQRYFDLGVALRGMIEEYPKDVRIALIATGHMTNSVGGPAMLRATEEPLTEWDKSTFAALTEGRVDALVSECTWDKLYEHGNGTPGFMVHLVAWGAAGGRVPSWADLTASPVTFANLFLEWNQERLNEGAAK